MGLLRKFSILLVGLLSTYSMQAQEMWGIVGSNYSGSNAALINPSLINSSKVFLDVNLLTVDVFAQNNYLFIPGEDYKPSQYFRKDADLPTYGDDNQAFDHYWNKNIKHAFSSTRVKGPSAMLVYNNHAFALHTGARVLVGGNRLPYEIANFAYEGLDYHPQWNINYNDHEFKMAAMAFGEIGLTYSNVYYKYGFNQWSAGVTLKYLIGYSGGYVNIKNLDYVVFNDSTVDIRNINAEAGFALPIDYNNNDFPTGSTFKGRGFGADLGITYTRTVKGHSNRKYRKLCRQPYHDYVYRIGFSIIDLGGIKFKDNAQKHVFENLSHYWERIDTLEYNNLNYLMGEISRRFLGNPDASKVSNSFSMGLPTAFSLQFDYHYYRNLYIGGGLIYPIEFKNTFIRRPSQVMITPRYETFELEFAMPVSLYDMKYPRIGLSARIYFLTVGTDKLGSFLGFRDFTGADLYFSIKLNFRKGWCRSKKSTHCENMEYGSRK